MWLGSGRLNLGVIGYSSRLWGGEVDLMTTLPINTEVLSLERRGETVPMEKQEVCTSGLRRSEFIQSREQL